MQIQPFIVMMNPHIKRVYDIYYSAFKRMIDFPQVKTPKENEAFVELLKDLVTGEQFLYFLICCKSLIALDC